jgi:hypothetical protein
VNGTCVGNVTAAGGSGTVNSGLTGYLAFYPSDGTTVDDQDTLFFNNTSKLFGIGTSSPFARLAVNPVAGNTNQFVVGSSSATSFIIDPAGNVGIGTTTPSGVLAIQASSTQAALLIVPLAVTGVWFLGAYAGYELFLHINAVSWLESIADMAVFLFLGDILHHLHEEYRKRTKKGACCHTA